LAALIDVLGKHADLQRLRLGRLGRRAVGRYARGREREIWLTLPDGCRVHAHLHRPAQAETVAAVLLIPGLGGAGADFDGLDSIISASELVGLGCACLHFDPPGLGRSWGTYDYGGPSCQAAVLAALECLGRHPALCEVPLGVLTVSLGIAPAAPVLAEHGERLGVSWLLDWEGPGDRQVITSFGTIMTPAMGCGLDDEGYWRPREAVRHVGRLRCRYLREQASEDHAQGAYTQHAVELVNAALAGDCPHVELNGLRLYKPLGPRTLGRIRWRVPGRCLANKVVLNAVQRLLED